MRAIVANYPATLVVRNKDGQLPLHHALQFRRSTGSKQSADVSKKRDNDDDDDNSLDVVIRFLVQHYPEGVRVKDRDGKLPLHYAVLKENNSNNIDDEQDERVHIVRRLFRMYPEGIQEKDNDGRTPLHCATYNENASIATLKYLVKHCPEGLREKDREGLLPLHIAMFHYGITMDKLRFLVEQFPESVREKDNEGRLPLHLGTHNENVTVEVLRFLAKKFPEGVREKDHSGSLPLHYAIRSSSSFGYIGRSIWEFIPFLFKLFPQSVEVKDNNGYLPLHWAACSNGVSLDMITFLVDQYPQGVREKTFDHGKLPLHLAVGGTICGSIFGDSELVEISMFLVEEFPKSVRVKDNDGYLPLHRAVSSRGTSPELIRFLVQQYPSGLCEPTHTQGALPLHLAVGVSYSTTVPQFLVKRFPGSVQVQDHDGYLPLHWAVSTELANLDMVRFLVQQFPQAVRKKTRDHGFLPLHFAVGNAPSIDLPQFLVEQFPESVQVKDQLGYLPLHRAAASSSYVIYEGDCDVVPFLVERFPQGVREKTYDHGYLPLHLAADYDKEGCLPKIIAAQYLIEQYPLGLRETTQDGWTLPVFLAASSAVSKSWSSDREAQLELVYSCVRQYPNWIWHMPDASTID